MKTYKLFILGLIIALGACGKKSSGNNNAYDPNYNGYQQPQYAPPTYNWNTYSPTYVPQGHCGSYQTLPSTCYGTYNGYSYCGNQWYYYWNNYYWSFPAFGSCGNTCSGSNCGGSNDDWWKDDDCDWDCDDDHDNHNSSYNSGWKKLWGIMGSSENRYITVKVPKDGTYYVSFKGNYTGKKQDEEKLRVKFYNSNTHGIKDLDNTHTGSGEVTRSCKVNVNFKLEGGSTYKIYLSGNEDSVNETYLRVTSYWPSDISKLCN